MKLDKILVPLDGSLFAEAALPKAVELIRDNDEATLILLRATEALTLPGVDPTDAQVTVVREAKEYLETMAVRLRDDGVPGVRTPVWYGAAAPSILESARRVNPDLTVMSTHGRSGIGRLTVGSVAGRRPARTRGAGDNGGSVRGSGDGAGGRGARKRG
jgi:nucleotide-binding universal stress UspA family protein